MRCCCRNIVSSFISVSTGRSRFEILYRDDLSPHIKRFIWWEFIDVSKSSFMHLTFDWYSSKQFQNFDQFKEDDNYQPFTFTSNPYVYDVYLLMNTVKS